MSDAVLEVDALSVHYDVRGGGLLGRRRQTLKAVENVSFALRAGETLGVVGETGCGKSSLGRAVLQLVRPTAGRVVWQGTDLCGLSDRELKAVRKDLQVVFQDPLSSLNPRMTILASVLEPLELARIGDRAARERQAREALERVGRGRDAARAFDEAAGCLGVSYGEAHDATQKLKARAASARRRTGDAEEGP